MSGDRRRWCPSCGAEHTAAAAACATCRVALVDELPWAEDTDLVEGVAFDLADWGPDLRHELEERLEAEGIAWAWDGDELVVEVGDEDRAEALIDELDFPDALEEGADEGEEAAEVMSTLFVAADRLAGDPRTTGAVVDVIEASDVAGELPPPFGFDPAAWRAVVERADTLAELLGGPAEDEEVVAAAGALRDLLRPYV